jgi:hypothetical protein
MKHSIINELYTCNKVLSVLEHDNQAIILIEEFSNSNGKLLFEQRFLLEKENLHSFIGTLLHVQQKMKGGK